MPKEAQAAAAMAAPTNAGPVNGAPPDAVALAQKYGAEFGVDPTLLLAVAKHETGFGTKGLGREGYDLGYGATDSGNLSQYAGRENQYREGAEWMNKRGIDDISDIAAGKAADWATDPNWEQGIGRAYQDLAGQLSEPQPQQAQGGEPRAHLGGTPLTEYGGKPVGTPIAQALDAASQVIGRPIPVTDGYRTEAQQADGYARKPGLVAPPGSSYHEHGLAVDVDVSQLAPEELQALAEFWKTNVPGGTWGGDWEKNEPWHFSIGEGQDAPPPTAQAQTTTPQPTPEQVAAQKKKEEEDKKKKKAEEDEDVSGEIDVV